MSKKNSQEDLKKIAAQFNKHINQQYQEAVSYVPDTSKKESVIVSNWLELSPVLKDALNLPGLPIGNITCIYGKPDSGKSTILMEAIAAAQKQGILPFLVLTEHKFDFNRLEKYMGADLESMVVLHADNLEQGYDFVEKILKGIKKGEIVLEGEDGEDISIDVTELKCFIFWDSIGNTMSESELEYDVTDWAKSMGKGAKAIKTLTRRVNRLLSKVRQRVGILLLNQSYMSMPPFGLSKETPYGGEGVPYSSALVIRLRNLGDIKMTLKGKEMGIGVKTKIQVIKNHITHTRPISNVFTVATGMISPDKKTLDEFKKTYMR